VDFAGPLKYKKSNKAEGKAYIVLYAHSLTRAIYVELLATLSAQVFTSTQKIHREEGTASENILR
jgi:hypothetical protein